MHGKTGASDLALHHSRYFRSNKTLGYMYSLGASRRDEMRNTRHKNTNDPQKKYRLGTVSKNTQYFTGGLKPVARLNEWYIKC